ncbi:hypothetical protein K1Y79_02010 [Chitinophaga sp. B61]|uniref:DUF2241 domain-containing protein n=2 Tax=Chitinophaga rhizophila TaxID=2866212 RepID=A0ABS7G604_9BACT|nr:hypothetical protein [Chitinophaga rhizophila]
MAALKHLTPILQECHYVFVHISDVGSVPLSKVLCMFREKETVIAVMLEANAKASGLAFTHVAARITLEVPSALAKSSCRPDDAASLSVDPRRGVLG